MKRRSHSRPGAPHGALASACIESCRERRITVRAAVPIAALLGLCVLSCTASRGGWDVAALVDRTPGLATHAGHRLGDLVPFPQLDGERVRLLTCRFAPDASVAVRGVPGAPLGERAKWISAATHALSVRVPGLALRWEGEIADGGAKEGNLPQDGFPETPSIRLESVALGAEGGARGRGALGDTQSECDIAAGPNGAVRGTLLRAAIRMRSQTADNLGRLRVATDAEWLGALMHELGHAVGFIGHVVSGDSLMVREESTLRRWGQRVLAGASTDASVALDAERGPEPAADLEAEPTLSALYALSPGTLLGERDLSVETVVEIRRLRALQQTRAAQGVQLVQVVAMAGDRDARIEWRYSDGSRFGVWFRGWVAGLRAGGVMDAELDLRTRRALVAAGL